LKDDIITKIKANGVNMFSKLSSAPIDQWQALSADEKKRQLYLNQKQTLDLFLERHAISLAQYNISLYDLTAKMGINEVLSSTQRT
jgi:hypothetical protein